MKRYNRLQEAVSPKGFKTLMQKNGYEYKFSSRDVDKAEQELKKAGIECIVQKHTPVRSSGGESLVYYTIDVSPNDYNEAIKIID